jgi:hypothetical protein
MRLITLFILFENKEADVFDTGEWKDQDFRGHVTLSTNFRQPRIQLKFRINIFVRKKNSELIF